MKPNLFHPAVSKWLVNTYVQPTPAQDKAWPVIKQGKHTLIAATTGSGKTLAAFLSAIDDLVREGLKGSDHKESDLKGSDPLYGSHVSVPSGSPCMSFSAAIIVRSVLIQTMTWPFMLTGFMNFQSNMKYISMPGYL